MVTINGNGRYMGKSGVEVLKKFTAGEACGREAAATQIDYVGR